MVVEMAMGADPPDEVAKKHGLTLGEYKHLHAQDWFVELVARKRQELHDNGFLFQQKAAMMAETLLTKLFQQSMGGQLAPPLMLDTAKQLVDIGRLKPQAGAPAGAGMGPAFQINIAVDGRALTLGAGVPAPVSPAPPVDVTPSAVAPAGRASIVSHPVDNRLPSVMSIEFDKAATAAAAMPPPPAYVSNFRVPNFDRDAVRPKGLGSLSGSRDARRAANSAANTPPAQGRVGLPSRA